MNKVFYGTTRIGEIGIAEDDGATTHVYLKREAVHKEALPEETPLRKEVG